MNQHLRLPLLLPYGHKVKSNTVSGRTHTHKHISFQETYMLNSGYLKHCTAARCKTIHISLCQQPQLLLDLSISPSANNTRTLGYLIILHLSVKNLPHLRSYKFPFPSQPKGAQQALENAVLKLDPK